MSEQFIFACTNIGNEALLKEEVRIYYPSFVLSYSRKGFITFKNTGLHYSLQRISQVRLAFATRAGICLGKSSPHSVVEMVISKIETLGLREKFIHVFGIQRELELDFPWPKNFRINVRAPLESDVFDIIIISKEELWIGIHRTNAGISTSRNSRLDLILPASAPSRVYLQIAEIIELYTIDCRAGDCWLDFGSAPGGSSSYLLERGCKVWGIDPAAMSEQVLKHDSYTHIVASVQNLSQEDLPDIGIRWVFVDLNLNPKQSIKEVLRLCKKYNRTLKGIIINIKMIKMDYVENIENFEEHFLEWGFPDVLSTQVPAHRNEYVLIARR